MERELSFRTFHSKNSFLSFFLFFSNERETRLDSMRLANRMSRRKKRTERKRASFSLFLRTWNIFTAGRSCRWNLWCTDPFLLAPTHANFALCFNCPLADDLTHRFLCPVRRSFVRFECGMRQMFWWRSACAFYEIWYEFSAAVAIIMMQQRTHRKIASFDRDKAGSEKFLISSLREMFAAD